MPLPILPWCQPGRLAELAGGDAQQLLEPAVELICRETDLSCNDLDGPRLNRTGADELYGVREVIGIGRRRFEVA